MSLENMSLLQGLRLPCNQCRHFDAVTVSFEERDPGQDSTPLGQVCV
jgi:hypothetical protein